MQTENRLLDDLAKVAAGAVGGLADLRHEIEDRLRDRVERLLRGMDLVEREEFEAVKAMAARARAEQETLAARVLTAEHRIYPQSVRWFVEGALSVADGVVRQRDGQAQLLV